LIVTQEAPPSPRIEATLESNRPSPDQAWIAGYWGWREGRHVWIAGYWDRPPHPHEVWAAHHWEHHPEGYVLVEGFWRFAGGPAVEVVASPVDEAEEKVITVPQPPPPLRKEIMLERNRPSRDHVWIAGYWEWRDDKHAWVAGHWEVPPHPRAVWVPPRWDHRPEGYVFIDGSWK
jgi:hypothetical protein